MEPGVHGALAPAEFFRAHAVAFAEGFRRKGFPGFRIFLGVVDEPEFERIDIQFVGEFVHRALEGEHLRDGSRRAHGAGCREIGDDVFKEGFRVRALVDQPGEFHEILGVILVGRAVDDDAVGNAGEFAVLLGGEGDFLPGIRAVAVACPHLLAGVDDTHRAFGFPRGECDKGRVVVHVQAGAKRPADEERDDADVLWLDLEKLREALLELFHILRFVENGELAVFPEGGGGVGFHRVVMLDGDVVFVLQLHRGIGVGLVEISAVGGGLLRLGFRGLAEHLGEIGFRILLVIFHYDEHGRMTCLLEGLGDDQGDRLGVEENVRAAQGVEFFPTGPLFSLRDGHHLRDVQVGENFDHAGRFFGGGGVHFRDAALGDVAGADVREGSFRQLELGGEFRGAGDFCEAIDPAHFFSYVSHGGGWH